MRFGRLFIFIGWLVFCYFKYGGASGAFYGFMLFGLLAYAWYWITDSWHRLSEALVRRPNVTNQTLNLMVTPDDLRPTQARRGSPVTTDDFAGMIEYRKNT